MVAAGASQPVLNVPFIVVVVTVNAVRWADFGMGDILDGNARNWRMYPNLLSLRNSATLFEISIGTVAECDEGCSYWNLCEVGVVAFRRGLGTCLSTRNTV